MAKCTLCGKDLIEFSKEQEDKILALIDKDSLILAETYPHCFNYCPNCGIIEHPFTPQQLEILSSHLEQLKEVNDLNIPDIVDPQHYTKSCLLAGECFSILNNTDYAPLCYKACEDDLSALLIKYLKKHYPQMDLNNTVNVVNLNMSMEDNDLFLEITKWLNVFRLRTLATTPEDVSSNPVLLYNAILVYINQCEMDKAHQLFDIAKTNYAGTSDVHDKAINYIQNLFDKFDY